MAISSMTGFARADGRADGLSWAWEVKSVNGRALDTRFRLPPGFDGLEIALRAAPRQAREARLDLGIARGDDMKRAAPACASTARRSRRSSPRRGSLRPSSKRRRRGSTGCWHCAA